MYNGLALLIDDESGTYWDHITGEAVYGPLVGERLDVWGVEMTNVEAALARTEPIVVFVSRLAPHRRLFSWLSRLSFMRGRFPPGFRQTMAPVDPRLPGMEIGLGVVTDSVQRFYPKDAIGREGIADRVSGRPLRVAIGDSDGVPYAEWVDGTRPFQLFSRWYGFSLTFPNCEVYES